ncbi:MAG: hypothetical protein AAFR90_06305, partial [Pseudomonadota bacterium]
TALHISMYLVVDTVFNWRRMMDLSRQPLHHTPEHLVGIGFRGWLAGYEYHDIACWELVWNTYATALGPKKAKHAVTDLSAWVRTVRQTAHRPIKTLPAGCCCFCEDERTAISIIAACQHNPCPALLVCARTLLGSSDVDAMLEEAFDFAELLAEAGQNLALSSTCVMGCADGDKNLKVHRH